MKLPTLFFVALSTASALLVGCGSDNTGGTGGGTGGSSGSSGSTESSSGSSGKTSSGSSGETSSSQTCQSSSLNGRCTDGPKKGSSCCYAPESADDPPCASSNECDSVCRFCK